MPDKILNQELAHNAGKDMRHVTTAIIVFAKAPQPGAVKTRLVPLLGEEGAAALHAKLVERTLETTRAASFGCVELHCAPDTDDPFFGFCRGHFNVTLKPQVAGDLGTRMSCAFESALEAHACVLLVGSDCPALTALHLRQAERALRDGADAVLVPCQDGGYALIGLRRVDAKLFDGIAWGSDSVMAETRARLEQLGWTWRELETLWDVDHPEDYARLVDARLLEDKRATA
jgi:rSAM/selenodomain-associated transferase 1